MAADDFVTFIAHDNRVYVAHPRCLHCSYRTGSKPLPEVEYRGTASSNPQSVPVGRNTGTGGSKGQERLRQGPLGGTMNRRNNVPRSFGSRHPLCDYCCKMVFGMESSYIPPSRWRCPRGYTELDLDAEVTSMILSDGQSRDIMDPHSIPMNDRTVDEMEMEVILNEDIFHDKALRLVFLEARWFLQRLMCLRFNTPTTFPSEQFFLAYHSYLCFYHGFFRKGKSVFHPSLDERKAAWKQVVEAFYFKRFHLFRNLPGHPSVAMNVAYPVESEWTPENGQDCSALY